MNTLLDLSRNEQKINDFIIKIEKDEAQCKIVWNTFTPNTSLFHIWDYRIAHNHPYHFPLLFITIYHKQKVVALIPLWNNTDEKRYEWFGGEFPEDNLFFTSQPQLIPFILEILPSPIKLTAILPSSLDPSIHYKFTADEEKYTIDINHYPSFENLLSSYKKKYRYNLIYDYKRIQALNPEILRIDTVKEYTYYMDILKEFSRARFHGEGDFKSIFSDDREVQTFIQQFKNQGIYKLWMQVIKIQNKVAVIDIMASYKNQYYMLSGANDIWSFPGVGFYANYIEMKDAFDQKSVLLDALQGDCGWKRHYFAPQTLLKFEK